MSVRLCENAQLNCVFQLEGVEKNQHCVTGTRLACVGSSGGIRLNRERNNVNKNSDNQPKALVSVFDELEPAVRVIEKLVESGIEQKKIEMVTHHIAEDAPEVETPKVHETMMTSIAEEAGKWGGLGASAGLIAGLLTPFPGIALGMAIMGGVTGAIVGGIAGADDADRDESVDLPTLEEYEELIKDGYKLVVVLGTHDEVAQAENVIKGMLDVRSHIHPVHGHEYHEHPAHAVKRDSE